MLSTISGDAAYQTIALLAGDYVETDSESTWTSQWFTAGSNTNIWTLNANMPIMGAIGNHETTGTGVTIFRKYWPYPYYNASRYYYSFDYGPVHFTVVDQYTSYTSGSTQHNVAGKRSAHQHKAVQDHCSASAGLELRRRPWQ